MFPPFPQERARAVCLELIRTLDREHRIDFDTPREAANPALSTNSLFDSTNALGQMFGVCICADSDGNEVVLKAFSGQFNSVRNVNGWVPPLLDTDAFARTIEESDRIIHELTDKIERAKKELARAEARHNTDAPNSGDAPTMPHHNTDASNAFDAPGNLDASFPQNALSALKTLRRNLSALQKERKMLSRTSMTAIFGLYRIYSFRDPSSPKTFGDILPNKQPPTGAGECCAPKLLSFAAEHNLTPLSLAEFYYGNENNSHTKKHGCFYPPCDEKCALVLPFILGLHILYRDESIIVINKPSGLLSIPGRGEAKADSATTRLKRLFPNCIAQPSVHRLDMDTSGLLVMAFTAEAHRALSIQFMEGTVQKKYVAVLRRAVHAGEGCTVTARNAEGAPVSGTVTLPFRLDVENRPYQIYDDVNGKIGSTDWRIIPRDDERIAKSFGLTGKEIDALAKSGASFVEFSPLTGRTHQLRTHSAHQKGLASPIVGDTLYGTQNPGERLLLHACFLRFTHPVTGEVMQFEG